VSRTRGAAESPPDGGPRGSIDCVGRRILGARTQASWPGSRFRDGVAGLPATHAFRARPGPWAPLRETGPGVVPEQALGGMKPRRAPTRRPRPGQGTGSPRERAPGGSKASKRACRPLTGEPGLNELVDREGARKRIKPVGLATAGNRRSRLLRRAIRLVRTRPAKSWRDGESDREKLVQSRAGGGRARTRKEARARESGYGSPGWESS